MNSSAITIRLDPRLHRSAAARAKQLGVSLSVVMRSLLHDFTVAKNPIILGDIEEIPMSPEMQA